MYELIMLSSGILLGFMFIFLLFTNSIIIFSWFIKKNNIHFEPKVSIVIPAYNEENNIKNCLNSIFNSNYPKEKFEIIVVDDGSTDKTAIAAKTFNQVKIVSGSHKGKSEALNLGFKQASNEFIITIDADTILEKDCIKNIVLPMINKSVGAISGATKVKNKHSVLGAFQNIEYFYNNLVRHSFSVLFGHTIWFHGAICCYRKSALKKAGYLKTDTLAEDLDISIAMYRKGYSTLSINNACAHTIAPQNLHNFMNQRSRWSAGVLQTLNKHKDLLNPKSSPALLFTFVNQMWWSLFAFISFPMFLLQIIYWMPSSSADFVSFGLYFLRWFSLLGPFYVVYNLPQWGFSIYNFFGVMSGLLTALFIIISLVIFKEKVLFKNAFALFFYFPYTILLNASVILSVFRYKFYKQSFFIR